MALAESPCPQGDNLAVKNSNLPTKSRPARVLPIALGLPILLSEDAFYDPKWLTELRGVDSGKIE